LGFFGFLTWAIASGTIMKVPFFGKIAKNVMDVINETGTDTLETRMIIWKVCLQELNSPMRIIFGMGDGNFMWLLGPMVGNGKSLLGYTHNGVLAMLDYGGVIRLVAYVAMLVYFVVIVIQNFRHKHSTTFVSLTMFLVFFIHGFCRNDLIHGGGYQEFGLVDHGLFACSYRSLPRQEQRSLGFANSSLCELSKEQDRVCFNRQ
jgi:hypothetical protein